MRTRVLLFAVVLSVGAPLGGAALAGPIGSADPVASAQEYAQGRTRGDDQAAHPDYRQRLLASTQRLPEGDLSAVFLDPYRDGWACPGAACRGEQRDQPLRTRYGAMLPATLYAPPASRPGSFPAIVYVAGGGTPDLASRSMAQSIAEAGYVVYTITAHDSISLTSRPPDPVPSTPENEYCRPYDHDGWQQPQELGIREMGPCAGQVVDAYGPGEEPPPPSEAERLQRAIAGTPSTYTDDPEPFVAEVTKAYEPDRAARVFPALDAADFLLSDDNPWRKRVDGSRFGIMGWSLGAHAALLAGNGDSRFDAVVTHDSFGVLGTSVEPTTPTLFLQHDLSFGAPRTRSYDQDLLPGVRDARRFAAADVPTGFVMPAASKHPTFINLDYPIVWAAAAAFEDHPDTAVVLNAPRYGERLAVHYTQAWFDRFLTAKGAKQRDALDRRLRSGVLDGSSDGSSIGQGFYDPVAGNRPYTVAGLTTAAHLSPRATSSMSLPSGGCADLRRGC